jgi:hypothetical protein
MQLPVLVAVAGAPWESALVAGLDSQPGVVRVVRRCVDVADLLAAATTGQARVALLSAHLVGLDVEVVDRLLRAGLQAVGVVTPGSSAEADQLRRVGVADRIDIDAIDHIAALLDGVAPPAGAAVDVARPDAIRRRRAGLLREWAVARCSPCGAPRVRPGAAPSRSRWLAS